MRLKKRSIWVGIFIIVITGLIIGNPFDSSKQVITGNVISGEDITTEELPVLRNDEFLPGLSKSLTSLKKVESSMIVDIGDGETYTISSEIIKKDINGKEIRMYGYNGMIPGPVINVSILISSNSSRIVCLFNLVKAIFASIFLKGAT